MMLSRYLNLFFLLLLLLQIITIQAHSTRSLPIQSTFQIKSASLEILNRLQNNFSSSDYPPPNPSDLKFNDSLLLRFSISTPIKSEFSLSLRPTPNLIHPNAKINYHSFDPLTGTKTIKSTPIQPDHVLAYTGWVIQESAAKTWWAEEHASLVRPPDWASSYQDPRVLGWARILIHDTSQMLNIDHWDHLVWEGSFESNQRLWHVKPFDTFLRTKHANDVAPIPVISHSRGGLVAWQEAQPESHPLYPPSACAHDQLPFNTDPQHNVYQAPSTPHLYFPSRTPSSLSLSSMSTFMETLFGVPSDRGPTLPAGIFTSRQNTLVRRQTMTSDISGPGNMSSNFISSIGKNTGCPIDAKVVFIGVAADCTYVSKHGTQDAARTAILNNVNSASALYLKTFNVSLGVVELDVQAPVCPPQPTADVPWNIGCPESGPQGLDLNQRLSVFSQWRGNKGGSDGAGLWHLMTNCSTGTEVGVAWLGQLCQVDAVSSRGQVTSGTGVTASSVTDWAVMAHEIGHNFGAIHDCVSGCSLTSGCCPLSASRCDSNSAYLMSPVSSRNASSFSPCSIGNICTTLRDSVNTSCLVTPGQRTVISLQQCGNGIVEPGEECDPGQSTDSPCCDPKTCKFSAGSVCDPMNGGCCTSRCQFASPDVVCRPAIDSQCDRAERCSGNSSVCPSDSFEPDGKSCGADSSGLSCASGMCTSRDAQCAARGASLGLKTACPTAAVATCQMACVDPTGRADCVLLTNNFIDGSPCGYGGRCKQGACASGNFLDTAKGWFLSNLSISIPIVVAAGILALLLLFALLRCIMSGFRGPFRRGKPLYPGPAGVGALPKPEDAVVQRQGLQPMYYPPSLPPPPHAHAEGPQRSNWVDPVAWNGRL